MGIETLYSSDAGPVWRHFAGLSAIPRPSKQEEQVLAYLRGIGEANGWEIRQDAAGNLVFALPGRGALESAPVLALQGHVDMVCEKNSGTVHDFTKDPIRLMIDGDWVTADGTTLGADNGVAVALGLAVAEADMPDRPPLELILTVDEETGLNGAAALDPSIVTATRILNLDSEEDGGFVIGCAGGADLRVRVAFSADTGVSGEAFELSVSGLRGGHSGVNIHEGRANAIRELAVMLAELGGEYSAFRLHELSGGNKRNAIPRECGAVISGVPAAALDAAAESLAEALRSTEPQAAVTVTSVGTPSCAKCLPTTVLTLIGAVPHGVIAYDPNFPELVQTSSSIGVAEATADGLTLWMHTRSSSESARAATVARIGELATAAGFDFEHLADYPGWEPNPNSQLLKHGVAVFEEVFGQKPRVEGIHAGLETGILGARLGTNELLAYGPTIENAHSPDERLSIESLGKIWRWLQAFVATAG